MTNNNKLPKVGRTYKRDCTQVLKLESFDLKKDLAELTDKEGGTYPVPLEGFLDHWEELPEQEPTPKQVSDMIYKITDTNKKEQFDHSVDVNGMVEEASKSIWKPISELPRNETGQVMIRQEKTGQRGVGYYSNGKFFLGFDGSNECFIKIDKVSAFCYLSDFINQQEQLEARIERIEKMVNSLVNTVFPKGEITKKDLDWAEEELLIKENNALQQNK